MDATDLTTARAVQTELVAVIVGVRAGAPQVLTTRADPLGLPSGPLRDDHRSMQAALRSWVEEQTGLNLGYVEQLYTFADRDRRGLAGERVLSVSYLALTRASARASAGSWLNWYHLYPWEDRREPSPALLDEALTLWADDDPARQLRCAVTFGLDGRPWLPDLALQRYEVLYEAGLIPESPAFDGRLGVEIVGPRLLHDHRRILATGIGRLRAKIQYRPVVFELMPNAFTLGQLQACVEAIAGQPVHKQNFRRLVAQQNLVEETGGRTTETGGRPARLYRFRSEITDERSASGTKLPRTR